MVPYVLYRYKQLRALSLHLLHGRHQIDGTAFIGQDAFKVGLPEGFSKLVSGRFPDPVDGAARCAAA